MRLSSCWSFGFREGFSQQSTRHLTSTLCWKPPVWRVRSRCPQHPSALLVFPASFAGREKLPSGGILRSQVLRRGVEHTWHAPGFRARCCAFARSRVRPLLKPQLDDPQATSPTAWSWNPNNLKPTSPQTWCPSAVSLCLLFLVAQAVPQIMSLAQALRVPVKGQSPTVRH